MRSICRPRPADPDPHLTYIDVCPGNSTKQQRLVAERGGADLASRPAWTESIFDGGWPGDWLTSVSNQDVSGQLGELASQRAKQGPGYPQHAPPRNVQRAHHDLARRGGFFMSRSHSASTVRTSRLA